MNAKPLVTLLAGLFVGTCIGERITRDAIRTGRMTLDVAAEGPLGGTGRHRYPCRARYRQRRAGDFAA